MVLLKKIRRELTQLANPEKAAVCQRFFKTGKGEYGYGDKFLGITVPTQRALAKKYYSWLGSNELKLLLASPLHEERLFALLILIFQYNSGDLVRQKKIFTFYLANISRVNNWDLIDLSAPTIVGAFLSDKKKERLHKLVRSKNLWHRRIAVVATLHFIRNNIFNETLKLAKKLLRDREDLIHKATGWMLREVGKRDFTVLNKFLAKHHRVMPRMMLRYAIERFPQKLRRTYLRAK